MSDQQPSINFPPSLPLVRPNQFPKDFFQGVQTAQVDTAANLAAANPILVRGQVGLESDTKYFKIGDGTTAYNSLSYQPQYGKVAPLPQTAAGIGQIVPWQSLGSGAAFILPAGGTWVWSATGVVVASGVISFANSGGGIAAGGTTVMAGAAGIAYMVWYWRIT